VTRALLIALSFSLSALALASAVVCAGCSSLPPPLLCGEIPDRGCPIGRGGSCDDAACSALYDCVEGAWTAVVRCDQAPSAAADAGAGAGGSDVACAPVAVEHAGEATGCLPGLQHPDCPVEAAEVCEETACATGCLDFFLCTNDGWTGVAYCTEQGQIIVTR
jgi:hypothetical protein